MPGISQAARPVRIAGPGGLVRDRVRSAPEGCPRSGAQAKREKASPESYAWRSVRPTAGPYGEAVPQAWEAGLRDGRESGHGGTAGKSGTVRQVMVAG